MTIFSDGAMSERACATCIGTPGMHTVKRALLSAMLVPRAGSGPPGRPAHLLITHRYSHGGFKTTTTTSSSSSRQQSSTRGTACRSCWVVSPQSATYSRTHHQQQQQQALQSTTCSPLCAGWLGRFCGSVLVVLGFGLLVWLTNHLGCHRPIQNRCRYVMPIVDFALPRAVLRCAVPCCAVQAVPLDAQDPRAAQAMGH